MSFRNNNLTILASKVYTNQPLKVIELVHFYNFIKIAFTDRVLIVYKSATPNKTPPPGGNYML